VSGVRKALEEQWFDGIVPGRVDDGFVGENRIGIAGYGRSADENNNQNGRLQASSDTGFACRASSRAAECFRTWENEFQPLRTPGDSRLEKEQVTKILIVLQQDVYGECGRRRGMATSERCGKWK
jgi:hypothetical protein